MPKLAKYCDKHDGRTIGAKGVCRGCNLEHVKRWAKANPERQRAHARKAQRTYKLGFALGESDRAEACRPGPDYACPICDSTNPGSPKGWQADHDHTTGAFRDWLCARCNNFRVAALEDRFIKVAEYYLKQHTISGNSAKSQEQRSA